MGARSNPVLAECRGMNVIEWHRHKHLQEVSLKQIATTLLVHIQMMSGSAPQVPLFSLNGEYPTGKLRFSQKPKLLISANHAAFERQFRKELSECLADGDGAVEWISDGKIDDETTVLIYLHREVWSDSYNVFDPGVRHRRDTDIEEHKTMTETPTELLSRVLPLEEKEAANKWKTLVE